MTAPKILIGGLGVMWVFLSFFNFMAGVYGLGIACIAMMIHTITLWQNIIESSYDNERFLNNGLNVSYAALIVFIIIAIVSLIRLDLWTVFVLALWTYSVFTFLKSCLHGLNLLKSQESTHVPQ